MAFTVQLTDDGATDVSTTGGKGANLGLLTAAGFRVHPGFTVTTAAYRHFVEVDGLGMSKGSVKGRAPASSRS